MKTQAVPVSREQQGLPDEYDPPSPTGVSETGILQRPRIRVIKGGKSKFIESSRSLDFRRRFFPQANKQEWNDWRWQLRNRIRTLETLQGILELSSDETHAILRRDGSLPLSITPYYASLIDRHNPAQALRRTVIPSDAEYLENPGESGDPLGEEHCSPVPGIVHRYPDRVLFLVTDFCSVCCRYCTRSRMIRDDGRHNARAHVWEQGLAYIQEQTSIRDVLISGGDPLTLNDEALEWLLSRLRKISHVELIRIGTKIPAVLPQRITPVLTRMLKRYHPLWMSLHFTHPDELTLEAALACGRLADQGMPLGSQTVLLSGINDDVETIGRLMRALLKMRVRPYYLYQCDPISGSAHFRTPISKGLEMIRGLRGHTSGYAVPQYVIDAPGGGGKIPLLPDYIVGRDNDELLLRNYEDRVYRYPDNVHT